MLRLLAAALLATAAPPLAADRGLQAWLRTCAAHCLDRLDRHAEALDEAERALAEPAADAGTLLRAHTAIGHGLLRQAQPTKALDRFRQAFEIAEAHGEPFEAAAALNQQAMAHQDLGQDEIALGLLRDTLARYRALDHVEGSAVALSSLGGLHSARSEPEDRRKN